MPDAFFTTSWDDGHPHDLRVAEFLTKHGFPGTFYVPGRNPGSHCTPEGLPVVSAGELRQLGESFEIGSHTLEHRFLDELSKEEAERQIVEGKAQLEFDLGRPVVGFCYPGGRFSADHSSMVRNAGFKYARTIVNFQASAPSDPYCIHTTFQFFPHSRQTYMKNYVKLGYRLQRGRLFLKAVGQVGLKSQLEAMLNHVCNTGGFFHLWGHSWEIERFDGWALLDDFLRYAAERIPLENRLCNGALLDHVNNSRT